jgi:hypothetical protein
VPCRAWPRPPASCGCESRQFLLSATAQPLIAQLFRLHPDHNLFESLPGAGDRLAPRLRCAFDANRLDSESQRFGIFNREAGHRFVDRSRPPRPRNARYLLMIAEPARKIFANTSMNCEKSILHRNYISHIFVRLQTAGRVPVTLLPCVRHGVEGDQHLWNRWRNQRRSV